MPSRTSVLRVLAWVVVAGLPLAGCECKGRTTAGSRADPTGDMSDRSYFELRGKPARVSGSGGSVRMEDFAGFFVWTEYAAPWCSTSAEQSRAIHGIEGSLPAGVAVLTVMTSATGGYGHPATRDTAAAWAAQHGLRPDRVVAADLTAATIPRHILYSPEGHVLFVKTGFMSTDEIRGVLARRTDDWRTWSSSGRKAAWMR